MTHIATRHATCDSVIPGQCLTLGDLYEAVGRNEDAARQFELARTLQTLVAADGGNVDLERLFDGDPPGP